MATCSVCNKTLTRLLKCSVCKKATYCSKECQRTAWPVHKLLCLASETCIPVITSTIGTFESRPEGHYDAMPHFLQSNPFSGWPFIYKPENIVKYKEAGQMGSFDDLPINVEAADKVRLILFNPV